MANQNFRPRNSSRAKAKAASEQAARLPMTQRIEMTNELKKNVLKLTAAARSSRAHSHRRLTELGISELDEKISFSGRNEAASIHSSG